MKHNIGAQDYWKICFKNIDLDTYDFSKSKPPEELRNGKSQVPVRWLD